MSEQLSVDDSAWLPVMVDQCSYTWLEEDGRWQCKERAEPDHAVCWEHIPETDLLS